MKRALIAGCSALFLIGSAHANTTTKFEAAIDVDRSETNPIVSIRSIERQAIEACSYEKTSVLAGKYDKACAKDLIEQTLGQLDNAELNQAYVDSAKSAS